MNEQIPIKYDFENLIKSSYNPSQIHATNTALAHYFRKYLLEKIYSCIVIENVPKEWAYNYMLYSLLFFGKICFLETDQFGVIPQHCAVGGFNVFYQPAYANVRNPLITTLNKPLYIGTECEVVKLQPNWQGVMDIVCYYADMLSLCAENIGLNIINSKLAYVFTAQNKSSAEAFKKMFDKIASGSPIVVQDKKLLDENSKKTWETFTNDLSKNYIADRILNDMTTWENKFNTEIGIPNANTQKRERLITNEVNANNIDTKSKILLWIDTMNNDFEKVNEMFNLKLHAKYKYEDSEVEQWQEVQE